MADERKQPWLTGAMHAAALWSLGVAHPIFDVLGENPAFFVAHDARPVQLVGFVLLVCGFGPLCAVALTGIAGRIGPRTRAFSTWAIVAVLLLIIALPIVKRTWQWDALATFSAAGAAGGLVALGYLRLSPIRLFVTFLTPTIIVVPALFILQPGLGGLLRKSEVGPISGVEFDTTPPMVMVVFDQLPLVSLLNRNGQIDSKLYPHFSSLADESTWFPNASVVSDFTQTAIPALLTGVWPAAGRIPVVDDHPDNLFTLLGSRYQVKAEEPITRLCPATVCEDRRLGIVDWFGSVLPDVAIVYLHIVLPDTLTQRLPQVTQNWTNFAANDNWRARWVELRGGDRQQAAAEFVSEIVAPGEDKRPPLYFLHLLIPHEPWVYLPSGQRYSSGVTPGLGRDGRWSEDEMPVLRSYQRHLLQVRFADTLLGQVLRRLREVGLYDDALIVVTADHGAVFQPGRSFRRPHQSSFVEMAAVPLLIKTPGQRVGQVVRSNIEAIDVVPTTTAILGVNIPWVVDGADMLAADTVARPQKIVVPADGGARIVGPADLGSALADAVAQKYARFDIPNGFDQPNIGLHDELVGRSVQELVVGSPSEVEVVVDAPELFRDVDLAGPFVPAHLTGAVTGPDEDSAQTSVLAVSLNGVVAGVTRPYSFPVRGRRSGWEVIIDARRVVSGVNDIGVYVIQADRDGSVVLKKAYTSLTVTTNPNLILDQAGLLLGVTTDGFFEVEWSGERPFRWIGDSATLRVPIDRDAPPKSLFINVLMTGAIQKVLVVMVNRDCRIFDAEISGNWNALLPLSDCRIDRDTIEIELRSTVSTPSRGDRRELGVAVGSIEFR